MVDPVEAKARYYQRDNVVEGYESWRFGSPGGRYVHRREVETVLGWHDGLAPRARILDMPVGTGRLAALIAGRGFSNVYGADLSQPMLAATHRAHGADVRLSRHDAFSTGFAAGTFDVVISLRFFFHFSDVAALVAELHRLLRPGGRLIFDTLRWSPRTVAPALQGGLGGRLYTHRDHDVEGLLRAQGFSILATERVFLLPSFAYRYVPGALLPLVDGLERRTPGSLRTKSLWLAERS